MEKLNTTSLTELNGVPVELGVTKVRADKFKEGLYIIPIFINEKVMIAEPSEGDTQPLATDAPWELYLEEKHGVGNLEYLSVEEFQKGLKEVAASEDRTAGYVMEKLNDLLTFKQYGRVKEILDSIDFYEYEDAVQVVVSTMVSSNPISPLLREIPKEENIKELNIARCKFYDRAYDFLVKEKGKKEAKSLFHGLKPQDYDENMKFYDAIWPGAPKEA
jgi:hypothetical protein